MCETMIFLHSWLLIVNRLCNGLTKKFFCRVNFVLLDLTKLVLLDQLHLLNQLSQFTAHPIMVICGWNTWCRTHVLWEAIAELIGRCHSLWYNIASFINRWPFLYHHRCVCIVYRMICVLKAGERFVGTRKLRQLCDMSLDLGPMGWHTFGTFLFSRPFQPSHWLGGNIGQVSGRPISIINIILGGIPHLLFVVTQCFLEFIDPLLPCTFLLLLV